MKQYLLLSIFLTAGLCAYTQFSKRKTEDKRPNIIVFMVDDMGWQDCSLPFWKEKTPLNERFHTPAMERLASEGMKFTNAYATPVCTPTRVSQITGMNVLSHHVTNWTSQRPNQPTDNEDNQFHYPRWNYNGLSSEEGTPNAIHATSYVQLLRDAGYFTVHVGKAHWGPMGMPGSNPHNIGFMVNIAGSFMGHPQSYYGKDNYGNMFGKTTYNAVPDLQEYHTTDTFLSEALTLEAIKAIEVPINNKQPFYLNLGHYAVHVPIMPDKRFLQKYLDKGLDSLEAAYATLIEGMDKSLGDLMDYLKKKDVDKNTIIIFMSDNGGLSNPGNRTGKPYTQNLPLRSGKGSVYEGGIREPMIVKWPNVTKPGSVANQYVIIEDFFPSILEMAQVKNYKTIQKIDGRSFVPILKKPTFKDDTRALFWHTPHKWVPKDGPGINYYSAIRKGDWKLVYSMRTGKKELYNLATDIGEQNDLSAQYPEKVTTLYTLLVNQITNSKAPLPINKSTQKTIQLNIK